MTIEDAMREGRLIGIADLPPSINKLIAVLDGVLTSRAVHPDSALMIAARSLRERAIEYRNAKIEL